MTRGSNEGKRECQRRDERESEERGGEERQARAGALPSTGREGGAPVPLLRSTRSPNTTRRRSNLFPERETTSRALKSCSCLVFRNTRRFRLGRERDGRGRDGRGGRECDRGRGGVTESHSSCTHRLRVRLAQSSSSRSARPTQWTSSSSGRGAKCRRQPRPGGSHASRNRPCLCERRRLRNSASIKATQNCAGVSPHCSQWRIFGCRRASRGRCVSYESGSWATSAWWHVLASARKRAGVRRAE